MIVISTFCQFTSTLSIFIIKYKLIQLPLCAYHCNKSHLTTTVYQNQKKKIIPKPFEVKNNFKLHCTGCCVSLN